MEVDRVLRISGNEKERLLEELCLFCREFLQETFHGEEAAYEIIASIRSRQIKAPAAEDKPKKPLKRKDDPDRVRPARLKEDIDFQVDNAIVNAYTIQSKDGEIFEFSAYCYSPSMLVCYCMKKLLIGEIYIGILRQEVVGEYRVHGIAQDLTILLRAEEKVPFSYKGYLHSAIPRKDSSIRCLIKKGKDFSIIKGTILSHESQTIVLERPEDAEGALVITSSGILGFLFRREENFYASNWSHLIRIACEMAKRKDLLDFEGQGFGQGEIEIYNLKKAGKLYKSGLRGRLHFVDRWPESSVP